VYVVDTATWATTAIALGASAPRDVDISPDGATAFVAGGDSGATDNVFVIDVASNTLTGSVPMPSGASNVNVVAAASQPVPVKLLSLSVE
jgi:DNA-binding beta-propeller fold protein YncE